MNMMRKPYDRIADVLEAAELDCPGRKLAAHEFPYVTMKAPAWIKTGQSTVDGRVYVGLSEATIARRLREMAALTRVNAFKRAGKNFVEYALIEAPVAA